MSARFAPPPPRSLAGFTLVEMMAALVIFAVGLMGVLMVINISSTELALAKEVGAARMASSRAIEILMAMKIRATGALGTTESTPWLFQGGYEIARTASGTSFAMPDLRTQATSSFDGIGGWIRADFPVPGLTPVTPNANSTVGTIFFHVDETQQAPTGVSLPSRAFPFPPSSGMTRLDCDGNGAATTANIRTGTDTAANRCRLVPARIIIEWKSQAGRTERIETPLLLVQNGL